MRLTGGVVFVTATASRMGRATSERLEEKRDLVPDSIERVRS